VVVVIVSVIVIVVVAVVACCELECMSLMFIYEGRSINKLQNGAIPLILKIGKIRNIRFVGNFILNIQKDFFG